MASEQIVQRQISVNLSESNQSSDNPIDRSNSTFMGQITFGSKDSKGFEQRLKEQKLQQDIKQHIYREPKWNNSFFLENPGTAIFAIICIVAYVYILLRTNLLNTLIKKIGFGALAILIYIIDCKNNSVGQYLDNYMTVDEFNKYIEKFKKMDVKLKYKVSAFHNETVTTRNSNGNTSTSTKKMVTYNEEFQFPITKIVDKTEDINQFFSQSKCLRLNILANYSYGDAKSEEYFTAFKKYAEVKASKSDQEYEAQEIFECEFQFKKKFLVVPNGFKKDAMFNKLVQFIYCMVGMSLIFRILLNRRVPFIQYCLHKDIYVDTSKKIEYYIDNRTSTFINKDQKIKEVQNSSDMKENLIKKSQTMKEQTEKKNDQTSNQPIKKQKTSKK